MHPADQLSEDHRFIERALNALEAGARRLATGAEVPAQFFLDAARFVSEFTDGAHHHKEEHHLFPALETAGMPRSGGPIGVMLYEHEEGRSYTSAFREAAQRMTGGDADAKEDVARNALAYVTLLRQHIQKEDNILFMMAKRMLPPDAEAALQAAFAEVDAREGGRAQWVATVEALERTVAT